MEYTGIEASASYSDSRQHFLVLDALRGVAAIMVVFFHILEVFSLGDHTSQIINHGYLAVDFFFMLSGFVMAHAYDGRWHKMTIGSFFKRRLIRLHPMIILGMTIGAILFYLAESDLFPKIASTSVATLLMVMLAGYTLIPLPPSMDIRGWSEMHPLNGPAWSLFFEYIANILHALILRRLSKIALGSVVVISAAALVHMSVSRGNVIGGWSLEIGQLWVGFTRLMFPYTAGMLLRRVISTGGSKNTFLLCTILLIAAISAPHIGGQSDAWPNGVYDAAVIIFIFPLVLTLGAKGDIKQVYWRRLCKFIGDISYPLYILHFPFTYVFYKWVFVNKVPIAKGFATGTVLLTAVILLCYAALKFYDEPLRRKLAARFLKPH